MILTKFDLLIVLLLRSEIRASFTRARFHRFTARACAKKENYFENRIKEHVFFCFRFDVLISHVDFDINFFSSTKRKTNVVHTVYM